MVVGQDRLREFDILLNKYNGKKGPHGIYNFSSINTVSAGSRDPDSEGVDGMSASKMRAAAAEKDFTSFSQGLPKAVSNPDAKALYNKIRSAMGLKEQKEFKYNLPSTHNSFIYLISGEIEIGQKIIYFHPFETSMIPKNAVFHADSEFHSPRAQNCVKIRFWSKIGFGIFSGVAILCP